MSSSSSAVVSSLASYLEKGWALVQTTCPLCSTPLVRSPSKTLFCAKCQMPVKPPNEASSVPASAPAAAAAPDSSSDGLVEPGRRLRPSSYPRDSDGLVSLSSNPQFQKLSSELTEAAAPAAAADTSAAADSVPSDAEIAARMERLNNVSALLGRRMLAGWTLLGVHCPDCNCPLVKHKKSDTPDNCECVACEKVYKENEDGEPVIIKKESKSAGNQAAAKATAPAPSRPAGEGVKRVAEPISSDDENTSDDEDWKLVKHRLHQAAGINKQAKTSETAREQTGPSSAALASSVANSFAPSSSNSVSARLGQLLLSGHTMLAEHCPNSSCHCPLMKNKDGIKICVECGAKYSDDESPEESKNEKQPKQNAGKESKSVFNANAALPDVLKETTAVNRSGFVANSSPAISAPASDSRSRSRSPPLRSIPLFTRLKQLASAASPSLSSTRTFQPATTQLAPVSISSAQQQAQEDEFSHTHKKPRKSSADPHARGHSSAANAPPEEAALQDALHSTLPLTARVLLSQIQRLTGLLSVTENLSEINTIAATIQTLSNSLAAVKTVHDQSK